MSPTFSQIQPSRPCTFNKSHGFGSVPGNQTYHDAVKIQSNSIVVGSVTRVGPTLRPGDVYSVRYWDAFTWTRQSNTSASFGPCPNSIVPGQLQEIRYDCKDACSHTKTLNASANNYMFVVGPINCAPSCMLIFFFNACDTLEDPFRACQPAQSALPQGIWLPAIYDRDTGTIFSETHKTTLNHNQNNTNELLWHIYTKAQHVDPATDNANLTMMRAKVTAHRCCATDANACVAQALQSELLYNILYRFSQDSPRFFDLVAAAGSIPAGKDPQHIRAQFRDCARNTSLCSTFASNQTGGNGTPCSSPYLSSTYAPCTPFRGCSANVTGSCSGTVSLDCTGL